MSSCHRVKIGRTSFRAGCGRKKRKDGVRRQKPHWGAKAVASARARAKRNPEFKAMNKLFTAAIKSCSRKTKAFSKARGACIKSHIRANK